MGNPEGELGRRQFSTPPENGRSRMPVKYVPVQPWIVSEASMGPAVANIVDKLLHVRRKK